MDDGDEPVAVSPDVEHDDGLRMKTSAGSLNRELNLRTLSSVSFRCPARNIQLERELLTHIARSAVRGIQEVSWAPRREFQPDRLDGRLPPAT